MSNYIKASKIFNSRVGCHNSDIRIYRPDKNGKWDDMVKMNMKLVKTVKIEMPEIKYNFPIISDKRRLAPKTFNCRICGKEDTRKDAKKVNCSDCQYKKKLESARVSDKKRYARIKAAADERKRKAKKNTRLAQ